MRRDADAESGVRSERVEVALKRAGQRIRLSKFQSTHYALSAAGSLCQSLLRPTASLPRLREGLTKRNEVAVHEVYLDGGSGHLHGVSTYNRAGV